MTLILALHSDRGRVSPEVRPEREWAWLGPPVKPSRRFYRAVSLAASVSIGMPVNVRHPVSVHPAELSEYLSVDDRVWSGLDRLLERSERLSEDAAEVVREMLRRGVRALLAADLDGVVRVFLPVVSLGCQEVRDDRFVARCLSRALSRLLGERACLPPELVGELLRCTYELAERAYVSVLLARAVGYRVRSIGLEVEEAVKELPRPRVERPPSGLRGTVAGLASLELGDLLGRAASEGGRVVVSAGRRLELRPGDYDPVWSRYVSRVCL